MDIIQEFLKLQEKLPRMGLYQITNINSAYTNYTDGLKNCYLLANAFNSEDCFYGRNVAYNINCVDCDHCASCELCYDSVDCLRCYNCTHIQLSENCRDIVFGYDLKGCANCIACVGLRQKNYYILNKLVSTEEYNEVIKKIADSKFKKNLVAQFEELKYKTLQHFAHIINSENCIGNYIINSKNCGFSFDVNDSQDCMYNYEIKKSTDCVDVTVGEFMVGNYECQSAYKLQNSNFCTHCWESSDLEFCDQVFRSHHCFLCVFLNHKQYEILNRPYAKEEYFKKIAEYKDQLIQAGLYGRWFIPSTHPVHDTCVVMERM